MRELWGFDFVENEMFQNQIGEGFGMCPVPSVYYFL